MSFEKRMINRLMAVDCPNCGLESLSTDPYPATFVENVTVTCGSCGSVGRTLFHGDWQYTDLNAWPLEQALNKRYPRPDVHAASEGSGSTLEW